MLWKAVEDSVESFFKILKYRLFGKKADVAGHKQKLKPCAWVNRTTVRIVSLGLLTSVSLIIWLTSPQKGEKSPAEGLFLTESDKHKIIVNKVV